MMAKQWVFRGCDIGGCVPWPLRPPSAAHEPRRGSSGAMVITFADDVAIVTNDTADIRFG